MIYQTRNRTKEKNPTDFCGLLSRKVGLGRGMTWVSLWTHVTCAVEGNDVEHTHGCHWRGENNLFLWKGILCASLTEQDMLNYAGLLILSKLFGISFVAACIHFWWVAGKGHSCFVKNWEASECSLLPELNKVIQSVHVLVTCHSNDNEKHMYYPFVFFFSW